METIRVSQLTDGEKDVLRLWVEHLTAKEIGQRLKLADRTVYQRLDRAKMKMGTDTPMQAALLLAQAEGRPTYAESAHQNLHVAEPPDHRPTLLHLLIPEASGRRINDLSFGQRMLVIVTRAILIALLMVAIGTLINSTAVVLRHLR